jgi:bacterioferritin-associated ferredoxin
LTYQQICSIVASGAKSVEDIQRQCGAGTDCGSCVDVLHRLVSDRQTPRNSDDVSTPPDVDSSAA